MTIRIKQLLALLAGLALSALSASSSARECALADMEIHNPPATSSKGPVVTYLGTTTALISDGETSLMTDGYFSRVNIDISPQSGGLIEPNVPVIEAMLRSQAIDELAAVRKAPATRSCCSIRKAVVTGVVTLVQRFGSALSAAGSAHYGAPMRPTAPAASTPWQIRTGNRARTSSCCPPSSPPRYMPRWPAPGR